MTSEINIGVLGAMRARLSRAYEAAARLEESCRSDPRLIDRNEALVTDLHCEIEGTARYLGQLLRDTPKPLNFVGLRPVPADKLHRVVGLVEALNDLDPNGRVS